MSYIVSLFVLIAVVMADSVQNAFTKMETISSTMNDVESIEGHNESIKVNLFNDLANLRSNLARNVKINVTSPCPTDKQVVIEISKLQIGHEGIKPKMDEQQIKERENKQYQLIERIIHVINTLDKNLNETMLMLSENRDSAATQSFKEGVQDSYSLIESSKNTMTLLIDSCHASIEELSRKIVEPVMPLSDLKVMGNTRIWYTRCYEHITLKLFEMVEGNKIVDYVVRPWLLRKDTSTEQRVKQTLSNLDIRTCWSDYRTMYDAADSLTTQTSFSSLYRSMTDSSLSSDRTIMRLNETRNFRDMLIRSMTNLYTIGALVGIMGRGIESKDSLYAKMVYGSTGTSLTRLSTEMEILKINFYNVFPLCPVSDTTQTEIDMDRLSCDDLMHTMVKTGSSGLRIGTRCLRTNGSTLICGTNGALVEVNSTDTTKSKSRVVRSTNDTINTADESKFVLKYLNTNVGSIRNYIQFYDKQHCYSHGSSEICVKLSTNKVGWQKAAEMCKQEGAMLATIPTGEVDKAIKTLANEENAQDVWIGLSYAKHGGDKPEWLDKTPLGYNQDGMGAAAHTTNKCYYKKVAALWYTGPCGDKKLFACQFESY